MSTAPRISSDYISDVLDEIALEGLDGITIEALWMRLSVRQNFCLKIDDNTKNFLWKIILQMYDVKFYELPEARGSLKHYDYSNLMDSQNASLELDEIYPYSKLKNVPGVLGSCQHYSTRVDITESVVKMSLQEANEKWGNKLVIVASQNVRCSALLGNFCSLSLDFTKNTIHYDILERLGRCRHLGLATCGKGSIQSVVEDPKSVFHYLKILLHHKLIRKQAIPGATKANPGASKVHLTRFYEECLNDNISILQTAIEELKTRPNYAMPTDEFYQLLDARKKTRLKKFRKSATFKKFLTITKALPYRNFFPDASETEWEKKSKTGERTVRCIQLVNPDIDVADLFDKECEPDDDEVPTGFLPKGIYFPNMPIIAQAFYHIRNSGAAGMTQNELTQKMGLSRKFVRGLIKRLSAEKHCKFFIENDGRRRSKRYIVGENAQTKEAASEIVQILSESAVVSQGAQQDSPAVSGENTVKPAIPEEKLSQIQDENVSYRTLRRIGMIMKLIKMHRIRLFYQITKHINEEEMKEGVTSKVDRGTVNRILQNLEKDGLLKVVHLNTNEKTGNTVKFYADPTYEPDEKQMETLYHINSSAYNGPDANKTTDESNVSLEHEFSNVILQNLGEMKKMLSGFAQSVEKPSQVNVKEREQVYSPKFIRLNILHDLIFYLVYDYTGVVGKNQSEMIDELCKTTAVEDKVKIEMPKLYGTQLSTYMFVPPLHHSGKMPGWFLISDILIRLPLSVLVKIVKVETCPELWTYLHHPIRRHFLVKDLPVQVRQIFFNRKNNMASLMYEFKRLCFIGLLQFGPKFGREIYQTFAFLNRKATLLDTSKSAAGYYHVSSDTEFERRLYYFETKNDIKKYWMDMFNICMGTNLGVKRSMIGKEIRTERELSRESLKKIAEAKSVEKVLEDDNGHLPGDGLGAAGLDSAMFSFLKSNWSFPIKKASDEVKKPRAVKVFLQRIKKEHFKKRLLLKRNRRKKGLLKTEHLTPITSDDKPKPGKFRKVKERECKFQRRKVASYDEIDLEALKYMNTLRVTWSTTEDNVLLICRVAMLYLCPKARTFVRIPWSEVRRVLQESCPESRNKTQKAIARRIVYMLKSPTTVRSVNLCLEELRGLPEVTERFDCSGFLDNIKPSTPNLSKLQNQLYLKFHELVGFLKDRFLESNSFKNEPKMEKDLIPDTINEFFEKYQFEVPTETQLTVKSVRENVIRAILMSSLSCRADKTNSSVQLFDIYRQYNDDELQNAVKHLYSDRVITLTKKKVGNAVFKSGKILPLSFTPYKLSFAFRTLFNMRFAHSIYSDSFLQINKLLEQDSEEAEVDLNDSNIALFLLASKNLVSFRAIIPEQIIILDVRNISDAAYSKMIERYREMLLFSGTDLKVVCSSGKIITRSEEGEHTQETGGEKRGLPDSESVNPKKPRLVEEKIKDLEQEMNAEDDATEERTTDSKPAGNEKDQLNSKTTKSSRVILYMMREEAKKEVNNDFGKMAQEFYVINASKVMNKLNSPGLEVYTRENGSSAAAVITKQILSRSSVPMNLVDENSIVSKFTEDSSGIRSTLDFISSKKEIGATIKELNSNCESSNLCTILRYLLDTKVVIKVGITETRFVSQRHCTPWLLNSFKMTRLEREKVKPTEVTAVTLEKSTETESDTDETPRKKLKGVVSLNEIKGDDYVPPACSTDVNNKIKIIIRPWIRIDGSLNRKVLDRFLGAVLAHIMVNPGITIADVMDKFSPAITPVWTKDLVEILFDIGCVTFTTLVVVEKANLFSKSVVQVSDCYTGLEEDNFVAVEAKMDAITTLGLFIGKKTYTKDFLLD